MSHVNFYKKKITQNVALFLNGKESFYISAFLKEPCDSNVILLRVNLRYFNNQKKLANQFARTFRKGILCQTGTF